MSDVVCVRVRERERVCVYVRLRSKVGKQEIKDVEEF